MDEVKRVAVTVALSLGAVLYLGYALSGGYYAINMIIAPTYTPPVRVVFLLMFLVWASPLAAFAAGLYYLWRPKP